MQYLLKLKDIIAYKSYLSAFKDFNNMLPLTLNYLFVIKSGPYIMRCKIISLVPFVNLK